MAEPLDFDVAGALSEDVPTTDAVVDTLTQVPASGKSEKLLEGQAVVVSGAEGDPLSFQNASMNTDKKQAFADAVAQRQAAVYGDVEQRLRGTLETSPDSFEEAALQAQRDLTGVEARTTSSLANELEVVEEVSSNAPISVEEESKRKAAVRLAALNDVAEMLDKQGAFETFTDYAGMMVPFGVFNDLNDVVDLAKSDWTNATNVEQLVLDWHSLPAERQEAIWPEFREAIIDAMGTDGLTKTNLVKVVTFVNQLFTPRGAEALADEQLFDLMLGLTDVATLGATKAVVGGAVNLVKARGNIIKAVADAGDAARAAKLNVTALTDEGVQAATGVDAQQAYRNSLPLDMGFDPGRANLSQEMTTVLNEFQQRASGVAQSLSDENKLIQIGAFRSEDVKYKIRSTLELMRKQKQDYFNEGIIMSNMKVESVADGQLKATYTLKNTVAGGERTEVTKLVNMTRDDVTGNYTATVEGAAPGVSETILSPSAMARVGASGDFHLAFKNAESLADISAASTSRLQGLVQDLMVTRSGVIGKDSLRRVEEVLVRGDEYVNPDVAMRGKVFTQEELIAEGLTSPAEHEIYYKYRIIADQFARLKNDSIRRELVLKGFENEVTINGAASIARRFERAADAKASIAQKPGLHAWDEDAYDSVRLTDELLDQVYAGEKMLVRTMDNTPIRHADGSIEHFEYAIVNADAARPLPEWVMHTKPGYVPKLNVGVEYLLKEAVPAFKAGVKDFSTTTTSRFFSSKQDALAFRQQEIERFLAENEGATLAEAEARFSVVADRELTPLQKARESIGSSGGMYTGARSTQDIKMGLNGVDVERVNPLEALQRNAQHLGAFVTRNEWRIGEQERWMNTVASYAKTGEDVVIRDFRTTKLPDNAFGRQMERQRELINMWAGIPNRDEQITGALVQRIHDWALGSIRRVPGLQDKTSVESIMWLKHSDPIMAIKSAVMHMTLGVMNLSQIPVQASAATVAAARFPRLAPGAIPAVMRMSVLDNIHDATALGKAFKMLGWGTDGISDDLLELHQAWSRTGFKESVRNNADLSVADNFGYITLDSLKRISDASLLPYRTGELFNRRFSFVISYRDWKRNNPGKIPTNKELNGIRQDAMKSMLELGHANRAFWQGGPDAGFWRNVLGMATQFQQVTAKATELTFKGTGRGGFTSSEKLRILLGQTALFGAAGIPVFGGFYDDMLEWVGIDAKDNAAAEGINQGATGILLSAAGADVDVAGRIAPFAGGARLVQDILYEDAPLMDKALGVFGDVKNRGLQAIATLKPLLLKGIDPDAELTRSDYLAALKTVGEIPSSGRNLFKAYMMHNSHIITDKHGNLVTSPKDFSLTTEVMAALGFRPNDELRTRIIQMDNKDFDSMVAEGADVIVRLWHDYLTYSRGDAEAAKALESTIGVIFDTIDNPHLQARIRQAVEGKVHNNPKSIQERELQRLLERVLPDEIETSMQLEMQRFGSEIKSSKAVVLPFAGQEE